MIYVARALAFGAGMAATLWPGSAPAGSDRGIAAFRSADYPTALEELAPAATAGEPDAAFTLGQMYAAGLGVPKDPVRAVELFRAAALRGHADAQHSLGTALFLGEGAGQDMAEGLKWVVIAGAAGLQKARDYLEELRPVVTSELIAEARRRARDWRTPPSQSGEAGAPAGR